MRPLARLSFAAVLLLAARTAPSSATTLAGVALEGGGVVLGADTRATGGSTVADKGCLKLHRLSDRICAAGAGTSAACDELTRVTALKLEVQLMQQLQRRGSAGARAAGEGGRGVPLPRLSAVARMLSREMREEDYGSAFLVGGADGAGSGLFLVTPDGAYERVPFAAVGSGMGPAASELVARYRPDMSEAEACRLVADAVRCGIAEDLGSGSSLRLWIVRESGDVESWAEDGGI